MDYRSLLKKYMTYVDSGYGNSEADFLCTQEDLVCFGMTEEECRELEGLVSELLLEQLSRIETDLAQLGFAVRSSLRQEADGTLTYVAPNYLADLKPEMGDG